MEGFAALSDVWLFMAMQPDVPPLTAEKHRQLSEMYHEHAEGMRRGIAAGQRNLDATYVIPDVTGYDEAIQKFIDHYYEQQQARAQDTPSADAAVFGDMVSGFDVSDEKIKFLEGFQVDIGLNRAASDHANKPPALDE